MLIPRAQCSGPLPLAEPQLGVRGQLRDEYVSGRHTLSIEDVTPFVREMAARLHSSGEQTGGGRQPAQWASLLVPAERVLRLSDTLAAHIGADAWSGEAVAAQL